MKGHMIWDRGVKKLPRCNDRRLPNTLPPSIPRPGTADHEYALR
jgi:hypothetical protein